MWHWENRIVRKLAAKELKLWMQTLDSWRVCVKCHDNWCKGITVMHQKPISVITALWPWLLTHKSWWHTLDSFGACVWAYMTIGVKGKRFISTKHHFQQLIHCVLGLWPFDLKINMDILDSWGVCVWYFKIIGVKGKQLCTSLAIFSNQCIVTLTFEPRDQ